MRCVTAFNRVLVLVVAVLAGAMLALQVVLMALKTVLGRLTDDAPAWMTEVCRSGMVFPAFLGGALAVYARAHMGIDLLVERLPRALARLVAALTWLAIAGFSALFAVQAWAATRLAFAWPEGLPDAGALVFEGRFLGLFDVRAGLLAACFDESGALIRAPFFAVLVLAGAASASFAFEHYLRAALGRRAGG